MEIFQKLTPFLADTLWSFHTWLPAVKKIYSVVRLTEGDEVEDAKLVFYIKLFSFSTFETTKKEKTSQHPLGDGTVSYIPFSFLSPPASWAPRRTLRTLRKTLLIRQLSHPSGCCLRLLFSLSSSAAGCDTSLTTVSYRIGKVAQWWGIDLWKRRSQGCSCTFNFKFWPKGISVCYAAIPSYILTHGEAATTARPVHPAVGWS